MSQERRRAVQDQTMPLAAAVVLDFWFGSSDLSAFATPERQQRWFGGGPTFDRQIADEFAAVLEHPEVVTGWSGALAGSLAAILVLDQFPRNVWRGTARAFAYDALAREVADAVVERGLDRLAGLHQRAFLYLPFEHDEDLTAQDRAVALFTALAGDVPDAQADAARFYLRFALEHRNVIRRFGRFPGRNAALGRSDTPEEIAWRTSGGSGWGQG